MAKPTSACVGNAPFRSAALRCSSLRHSPGKHRIPPSTAPRSARPIPLVPPNTIAFMLCRQTGGSTARCAAAARIPLLAQGHEPGSRGSMALKVISGVKRSFVSRCGLAAITNYSGFDDAL